MTDPPLIDPPEDGPGGDARVAGVLLAAGTGSRFGDANKLLAEVEGEPIVRRAARTLLGSSVAPVAVVVGHEADRVRAILDGTGVEFVGNPDYREGQATSVRAGLRAVSDADAVAFALGDMPCVSPSSVDALVRAYRAGAGDALAAAYRGRRGNPVLFDARHFDRLGAVEGDTGGRAILLGSDRAALVETGDPGVVRDVDTEDDLERLR